MVRASAKMHGTTFIDLDIRKQMIPLRKLYLMTLTYFSGSKSLNFIILETARASETREMSLSIWRF